MWAKVVEFFNTTLGGALIGAFATIIAALIPLRAEREKLRTEKATTESLKEDKNKLKSSLEEEKKKTHSLEREKEKAENLLKTERAVTAKSQEFMKRNYTNAENILNGVLAKLDDVRTILSVISLLEPIEQSQPMSPQDPSTTKRIGSPPQPNLLSVEKQDEEPLERQENRQPPLTLQKPPAKSKAKRKSPFDILARKGREAMNEIFSHESVIQPNK